MQKKSLKMTFADENDVVLFWFRRDLRLKDNAGLWAALQSGLTVVPVFIFDTNILDKLEDRDDARVSFLLQALENLNDLLQKQGSSVFSFTGSPLGVFHGYFKSLSSCGGTRFSTRL